jgi:hypothetical protein
MKTTLKLEEVTMLFFSVYLFNNLTFNWWWYLILFLLPDISFLGYAVNNKFGAFLYNVFHHKGVAILLYIIGVYSINEYLQLAGIILFGHSSFDRILGYGLKYTDSFNNTHLGKIGNKK